MSKRAGRSGRPWRRLRAEVLATSRVCALRLEGCTGYATTVDHIAPLHAAPHLAEARHNLRPACSHCQSVQGAHITNSRRGAMRTTRRW